MKTVKPNLVGWIRFRAAGQAFQVHKTEDGLRYHNPILNVLVPLAEAFHSKVVPA